MVEISMKELLSVIKADAKVDIKIQNEEGIVKSFDRHELSLSFAEFFDRRVRLIYVGENNHLVVELYK